METTHLILDLLVVFAAARIAGEIFEHLSLPAVVGEILAGILIGPSVLGWVHDSAALSTVATLGVVVLQFSVGLETKPSEFLKAGWTAVAVALLGVAASIGGGFAFGRLTGLGALPALFVGAALASTSVGVSARVLKDRGLLQRAASRIILAAAVIDDILGPLVLGIVVAVSGGSGNFVKLALLLAGIAAFVVFEIWIAPKLVARHAHVVEYLRTPNAPFVVAVVVMLFTAAIAEQIGLAAVVGAFLAGMMLAETEDRYCLSRDSRPLYDWLVPYFFAVTGMRVQLSLFANPVVLALGVGLAIVAIAAKLAGCSAGAASHGWRQAMAVGVGMIPRAEIGLIVASVGLSAHLMDSRTYAVVLFAIVATLLVAPLLIPAAMRAGERAS
jgi:Kef-type K+ transport system membrane component KefB